MKKKLLNILFLVFAFNSFSQIPYLSGIPYIVPETWEVDIWNGANWINASQITYTFNESCLPTLSLSKGLSIKTNVLENIGRQTIIYNATAPQLVSVTEVWNTDTNSWDNIEKIEYIFDVNDDLVEVIDYDWISGDWELEGRIVYVYGSLGYPSQITVQSWDITNSVWINSTDYFFTYTSGLIATQTSYNWSVINSAWEEDTLEINTYSGNLLSTSQEQEWDGSQWVNNYFDAYAYDGDLLTTSQRQEWGGSQWVNNYFETYTYDGNNYLIESFGIEWNGISYENDTRSFFANNVQGYPVTTVVQSWSLLFGWSNAARYRRTYPNCALLSVNSFDDIEDVVVYPNPTKDVVFISVNDKTLYSVSNVHGQLIEKGYIDQINNSIDLSRFNSGLYFISLNSKNQTLVKRIIKK